MWKYANLAEGTLATAYTVGDTNLVLNSGQGALFPVTGDFMVALNSPTPDFWLKCTGRSGDTLTVSTTGQEGSTAINESVGTKITLVITAGVFNTLGVTCGSGPLASMSSGVNVGDLYFPNDSQYDKYRWNGTIWEPWKGNIKCTIPLLSDFTWVNQGSSTADNNAGALTMHCPLVSGDSWSLLTKAVPTIPYTITSCIKMTTNWFLNYPQTGIGWLQDDGKMITFRNYCENSNLYIDLDRWNNQTSEVGRYGYQQSGAYSDLLWLRICEDTINRTAYFSHDGLNWIQWYSVGRTDFITATKVFFGADSRGSELYSSLIHWNES